MRLTYEAKGEDSSLNNTSVTDGNDGSLMIDEVEMSGCDWVIATYLLFNLLLPGNL